VYLTVFFLKLGLKRTWKLPCVHVHPRSIRNGLMFCPSPCPAHYHWRLATMASADRSSSLTGLLSGTISSVSVLGNQSETAGATLTELPGLLCPLGCKSLILCLSRLHLHSWVCWLRALQWCGCSPTKLCLLCSFCSSVQTLVVPLLSDSRSPETPLRLTNGLRQLAHKGLAPSG